MITDDDRTIQALRTAMATQVRGHHLRPEIAEQAAGQVAAPSRLAHGSAREYLAIAACVLVVVASALIYVVARANSGHDRSSTGAACTGAVADTALPTWARSGFSAGNYVAPHVTGADDKIIGVLFTDPLLSPPAKDHNNKILWVAKEHGTGPLVIRAQVTGTKSVATRTVADGPGPSIIDLPAPGCWQLTLTWSGHRDTLAVPYTAND